VISSRLDTIGDMTMTQSFKTDYISSENIIKNFITYIEE